MQQEHKNNYYKNDKRTIQRERNSNSFLFLSFLTMSLYLIEEK
jgi:hypothetical protein